MSASCSARRVRVDGAVAVDEHAVGEAHQEHAGDDRDARARLDQLERRADRLRGRVRGAGDHPVDHPQRDHHRPEVGDVGRPRRGPASTVTPLCARRCAYSCAKRSTSSGSVGSSDVRAVEVEPEPRRPRRAPRPRAPSSVSSTTRRRSRMSAARSTRSSVPSGSTMCRPAAARAVEQRVLEHQRRDRLRARDVDAGRAGRRRRRGSRTAPAPW